MSKSIIAGTSRCMNCHQEIVGRHEIAYSNIREAGGELGPWREYDDIVWRHVTTDYDTCVPGDGSNYGEPGWTTIVCLCGSSRFYEAFQQANYERTMAGEIVLSIGFYPHSSATAGHGEGVGHDSIEKVALDELHKRKIDLADYVLVLNVGGYIGESTRSEITYADANNKPIVFLEEN